MKEERLLEKIDKIKKDGGWGIQKLFSKDYGGSCPCFSAKFKVNGEKCEIWGRCWRVSENTQDLHVMMPKNIAHKVKECLDAQHWYSEYTLIFHKKPFL